MIGVFVKLPHVLYMHKMYINMGLILVSVSFLNKSVIPVLTDMDWEDSILANISSGLWY